MTALPDAALPFRESMALLATGVTVVTLHTPSGPAGMTASAVCSLSLEPAKLVVCVQRSLPTHTALTSSTTFAVNVLGEEGAGTALKFATPGANRFAGMALREEHRAPVLAEAIAYFVCEVDERYPGGDHSIFVGRVLRCGHEPGRRPLLYFGRSFEALKDFDDHIMRSWAERGTQV